MSPARDRRAATALLDRPPGPMGDRPMRESDPAAQCLERWSSFPEDLVLLRESSIARIEAAESDWREGWGRHVRASERLLDSLPADHRAGTTDAQTLRREHGALVGSLDELSALVEIVRHDGHGGNRQALGQYWRLLREALERHIRDEAELPPPPPG